MAHFGSEIRHLGSSLCCYTPYIRDNSVIVKRQYQERLQTGIFAKTGTGNIRMNPARRIRRSGRLGFSLAKRRKRLEQIWLETG